MIRQARNGNTYLRATLFDATGSITMVCWEYDGSPIDPTLELVYVVGTVHIFHDKPQFNAENYCLLAAEDCDTSELNGLIPCAPIDVNLYEMRLNSLIHSISDSNLYSVCFHIFREHWGAFTTIPAAQIKHHAYLHGLLMHTVDTADLADSAARNRLGVNRDLLVAGALLHDIGKIYEFERSACTGLVTGYSEKGQLLGHAAIGFEMIGRATQMVGADPHIANLLRHMVLNHHTVQPSDQVPMAELEMLRKLDAADSSCERCLESRRSQTANAAYPALRAVYPATNVKDDDCF